MSRTLILQSYRAPNVEPWIARCMKSVEVWAGKTGFDYRLTGDEVFALCGDDYLARAGGNMRTITNLCRLEMVRAAHQEGYDWAVGMDADIFVFDPDRFRIEGVERYAFVGESWIELQAPGTWGGLRNVNNSVFVCRAGEPDLDFLIHATRHVAMSRTIVDNFQVGRNLVNGLRKSLAYETLNNVGMFSNLVVLALARDVPELLQFQADIHGYPVFAANLCGSENYVPPVSEGEAQVAMDRLETSRGTVINSWLSQKPIPVMDRWVHLQTPDIEAALIARQPRGAT